MLISSRLLIVVNGSIATFFIVFLAYTFFAYDHILGLAREFVSQKTEEYAQVAVDLADEALQSEIVKQFMSKENIASIKNEIEEFRANPSAYVATLTGEIELPPSENSSVLLASVTNWKKSIRDYFNNTLSQLIWDLRIFAGTNVAAACGAIWLALGAKGRDLRRLRWLSLLLTASTVLGVYFYIDSFSFFQIVTSTYLGWTYPVIVLFVFVGLYQELGERPQEGTPTVDTVQPKKI